MTSQALVKQLDITGLTSVTGSEMNQLVDTALPASDKGFQIETTDSAVGVPVVPEPRTTLEGIIPTYFARSLWKRVPHAKDTTGEVKTYQWNPNIADATTYLKWVLITSGAEEALATAEEALETANDAAADATTANTNATAAVNTANGASAQVTLQNARIAALENYDLELTDICIFQGTNNSSSSTTYKMILDPVPAELSLYAGQKVSFVAPVTCGLNPRFEIYSATASIIGSAKFITKFNQITRALDQLQTGDIIAGQVVELTYDGTYWQLTTPTAFAAQGGGTVSNSYKNLLIYNNVSTPLSKIDITADEVVVTNTASIKTLSSIALTIDTATTGANGTEAAVAADRWYYIFVIYDPTNNVKAGFMAESSAPTLPGTYTMKALVGMVYRVGTNLRDFYQIDNKVFYNGSYNVFTSKASGVAAGTYIALSAAEIALFASYVPPNGKHWVGQFGLIAGAYAGDAGWAVVVAANSSGLGKQLIASMVNLGGSNLDSFEGGFTLKVPVKSYANPVYWKTIATSLLAIHRFDISGFEL